MSAQDDLGLETVGANLLRRLLPGIVQTTPNAGHYAFYPYLLWRWEQDDRPIERVAFKTFYRRQESAYALACLLHEHRGPVIGINGWYAATDALHEPGDEINVAELADRYMDSTYGGYGLFYARVLADMRLTKLGAARFVDRTTETGARVATAFAEAFEQTRYFREFFEADVVPREVLAELGDAVCLCTIPGRSDQEPLLDLFFGDPLPDPAWELRRRTRIGSLALFLEFHRQRPPAEIGSLAGFRRVLAAQSFADGTPFQTAFPLQQNAWRLYQLRECQTLALTSMWSAYLRRLEQLGPTQRATLTSSLVQEALLGAVELEPGTPLGVALERSALALGAGADLVDASNAASHAVADEPELAIALALQVLLALTAATESAAEGFVELVGEGGPGRWSLAFMGEWFARRSSATTAHALGELLSELHDQHSRVAISKLVQEEDRDPFCIADDDGLIRLVRLDEPFWTTARFTVVNNLLWSLGLITTPDADARLTDRGEITLERINAGA